MNNVITDFGALLIVAIFVALLAAFVILFISKRGWRERMEVKAPKLLSEMASCDFCLSWWTCLAVTVFVVIGTHDVGFLLSAVAATPITRYIIY